MKLNALTVDCTLKKSPEQSSTEGQNMQDPLPPEGNTVPGWQPQACSGHDDRMPGGNAC